MNECVFISIHVHVSMLINFHLCASVIFNTHRHLVFPVVVILDEVEDEVENVFRTQVVDISQQRHSNRHRLDNDTT